MDLSWKRFGGPPELGAPRMETNAEVRRPIRTVMLTRYFSLPNYYTPILATCKMVFYPSSMIHVYPENLECMVHRAEHRGKIC